MVQQARVHRASKVLDQEIAVLREQATLARRKQPKEPATHEAVSGLAQAGSAPSQHATTIAEQLDSEQRDAIEALDARTQRLITIKSWIETDGALLPLIAKVAGNVEDRYMRKNLIWNVLLSSIFLIAGWLLSIIATPAYLSAIFRH